MHRCARRFANAAIAVALAAAAGASSARAADPLYSSIKPEDCILFDIFVQGASTACRGIGGYNLTITDADLRIHLSILRPEWEEVAKIDLMKITGGGFSSLPSQVVEWRGPKNAPTAVIMRLGFNEGDGKQGDQALTVIRLDKANPANTCLIGAAKRGPQMNDQARRIADDAAGKPCL